MCINTRQSVSNLPVVESVQKETSTRYEPVDSQPLVVGYNLSRMVIEITPKTMMILFVATLLITLPLINGSSPHVQSTTVTTSSHAISNIRKSHVSPSPTMFMTSNILRGGSSNQGYDDDSKNNTVATTTTTNEGTLQTQRPHKARSDSAAAVATTPAVQLSQTTLDHVREAPLLADIELLSQLLSNLVNSEDSTTHTLYEFFRIAGLERASHPHTTTSEALRRMIDRAAVMTADQAVGVMRTFSIMLNLVNSAEVTHRTRIAQQHELVVEQQQTAKEQAHDVKSKSTVGPLPLFEDSMRGTMDALLSSSSSSTKPVSAQQIYDQLLRQKVEIVLTAHPTQVQRKSLLRKYRTISETLQRRNHEATKQGGYGPIDIRDQLARIITSVWGADEIRRSKPTPQQEAAGGNAVIETVLWDAVPAYLRKLHTQCHIQLNQSLPIDCCPIKFASWIGGDRDGTLLYSSQTCHVSDVSIPFRRMAHQQYMCCDSFSLLL